MQYLNGFMVRNWTMTHGVVLTKPNNPHHTAFNRLHLTQFFNSSKHNRAGSSERDSTTHVEQLFKRVNNGVFDFKPDLTTYNTLLQSWNVQNAENSATRSTQLLKHMIRTKEGRIGPDCRSFSIVINTWAKSSDQRNARESFELLNLMKGLAERGNTDLKPNAYIFAGVLRACAHASGSSEVKHEAFHIASEVFEESIQFHARNHIVYGTMMKTINNLMDHSFERESFVESVFKQCCEDGQVGDMVVHHGRKSGILLEDTYIPKDWRRNLKNTV
jgi:hypothetical protein